MPSHPAPNSYLQESEDYWGARTDAAEGGDLAAHERDKAEVRRRGATWVEATNGADVFWRGFMVCAREGLVGSLLMSAALLLQLTGAKFRCLGIRNS